MVSLFLFGFSLFVFHFKKISYFVSRSFISCRSTEHGHVKDNLPAKLLRIQTFGKMKLEEFKDLISPKTTRLARPK